MKLVAILVLVVLLAGYLGYITIPGITPSTVVPPGVQPTIPPSELVSVTKQIKIVAVDELAGGALDGTTSAITVYDSDGQTILETCTLSSGSCTTANSYTSGKVIWVRYLYDTTIDAYMWWRVVVPQMGRADAESLTTNTVTLKTREAGAYTDSLITSGGHTITDATYFNTTGSSNDTLTATYTFYTTSDNTGYPTFFDPIYNIDCKIIVWATLSGTGYDSISLTGFDGGFEKGSTMYYYKVIDPNMICKYKVGNNYIYPGSGSVSFAWNAAGFSNSTSSVPTLYLYLKIYSSVNYMQQYGDYGPYDFTGCSAYFYFADTS